MVARYSLEQVQAFDAADPLARYRDEFFITDPNLIYLDGNSLGRLPKRTAAMLQDAVNSGWGERLVRSWGEDWFALPRRAGEKIAALIGAAPGQVICTDSTSINLYKLVEAAIRLRPERDVLLSTTDNFPSDIYILQGCAQAHGKKVRLVAPEEIEKAIDAQTALVALSHVAYKSGALYDGAAITALAHRQGALMLWDLSHSAGAVPIFLDDWQADFAVGCTYKYLNGGPGAPAYLYVNQSHLASARSPVWGWFGEAHPFQFDLEYHPSPGIERFQTGTPPVLSMLAAEAGIDITLSAGIAAIRKKSIEQTNFLWELANELLVPLGFRILTPADPDRRGSHISLQHTDAYRINSALIETMQVIPDFREPDVIRLGLAPLYTTYLEVWKAVQCIRTVITTGLYENRTNERSFVT